MMIIYRFGNEN